MRFNRVKNRRVAASEAVGAMLAIAMTLIAGAAAWGFVRSQAASSESALQGSAVATNNMLGEHFAVADMYFGSTTTATFLVYNTGTLTFQVASVRLYDSAGLVNVYYNSTGTGASKADKVYDLKSSLATKCKVAGTSYESPLLTMTNTKTTDEAFFTITIPPTTTNCPSYGQLITTGTTYTIVVTGLYGNSITFSQQD